MSSTNAKNPAPSKPASEPLPAGDRAGNPAGQHALEDDQLAKVSGGKIELENTLISNYVAPRKLGER
jgi:hypothetical protein